MKVKELIQELQKCDQETQVHLLMDEIGESIADIGDVTVCTAKKDVIIWPKNIRMES